MQPVKLKSGAYAWPAAEPERWSLDPPPVPYVEYLARTFAPQVLEGMAGMRADLDQLTALREDLDLTVEQRHAHSRLLVLALVLAVLVLAVGVLNLTLTLRT